MLPKVKPVSRGVVVNADQYAYEAGSSGLSIRFPAWALEGGRDQISIRLNDPDTWQKIKKEMVGMLEERGFHDLSWAVVATYRPDRSLEGLSIKDIAMRQKKNDNSSKDKGSCEWWNLVHQPVYVLHRDLRWLDLRQRDLRFCLRRRLGLWLGVNRFLDWNDFSRCGHDFGRPLSDDGVRRPRAGTAGLRPAVQPDPGRRRGRRGDDRGPAPGWSCD